MDGARVKGVGTDRHALTWRERQACVCVCVFGDVNTCEGTKHIKRIEAIRGQILSKLRMTKEPEVAEEEEEDEVPADVLSVYDSTVELSEELMQITKSYPDEEEEAYYAQEVHKFNMTTSEYVLVTVCLHI